MSRGDSERVYRWLHRALVEGAWGPDERLIEQQIADKLEVSRTPVREALRRLSSEGLVTIEHNRGAHVRSWSQSEIVDLYEIRARLEAYVAEAAAVRRTPDQLAALNQAVSDFEAVARSVQDGDVGTGTAHRLMAANSAFHGQLLACASSDGVLGLISRAVDLPLVFRSFRVFRRFEVERSNLFHRLIAEAVAAGQPDRAGRLMTEHVLQGRDALLAADSTSDQPESLRPSSGQASTQSHHLLEI